MKVKSVKRSTPKTVHDMKIDDEHHYILSNGTITHNSGGGGLKYAASTIIFLSKAKYKEKQSDKQQSGAKITCTLTKSRKTREGKKVQVLLHHDKGLDPYFGLIDIAEEAGVVKRISGKVEFPNGEKAFEKTVHNNPEKYFTKEVLDRIDEYTQNNYTYGGTVSAAESNETNESDENEGE